MILFMGGRFGTRQLPLRILPRPQAGVLGRLKVDVDSTRVPQATGPGSWGGSDTPSPAHMPITKRGCKGCPCCARLGQA